MSGRNVNDGKGIEARLDRSLRSQVRLPTLGKAFDAAVWARIEAEESAATNPGVAPARGVKASRWLALTNLVGVTVTLGVALYFAMGSLGGIHMPDLTLGVEVSMPAISDETLSRALAALGQLLGVAALLFGLSFTSFGRRVRASFS